MGFSHFGVEFLVSRAAQRPLGRTATIGRHWLFCDPREITQALGSRFPDAVTPFAGFSEGFLTAIGASEVVSFDASHYEDATVVHDMNEPIPPTFVEAFDTVIDEGSLEHIFDVRTALANVMRMPRLHGRALLIVPANNQLGHGLYQFSPDLYFRAFSAENGYRLVGMHAAVSGLRTRLYKVTDPLDLGRRAEILTSAPTFLCIEAERVEVVEPFEAAVQQSDYSVVWAAWAGTTTASSQTAATADAGTITAALRRLPPSVKNGVRWTRVAHHLRRTHPGFEPVDSF